MTNHPRLPDQVSALRDSCTRDLANAHALARAVTPILASFRDSARDLSHARAIRDALDREIDHIRAIGDALDREIDRARMIGDAPGGAPAFDLVEAFQDARDFVSSLSEALNLDLDINREIVDCLETDDHDFRIDSDGALDDHHTRVLILARNLNDALTHAHSLAAQMAGSLAPISESGHREEGAARQNQGRRVAPSAARVLAMASRMLPAADRARYAEEFRSELWDLARAGSARRAQVAYAAHQVESAMRLRAALRAPARRRATP